MAKVDLNSIKLPFPHQGATILRHKMRFGVTVSQFETLDTL